MNRILLVVIMVLPLAVVSQKISTNELSQIFIEALADFENVPLKLNDMDSVILVSKPECVEIILPKEIGKSMVQWVCLDEYMLSILEGNNDNQNGRSVILMSYKKPNLDTLIVRIDQWTLKIDGQNISFVPINENTHPEYKVKNHEFLFVKTNSMWRLEKKANQLKLSTEKEKEIEELFQKGNSLYRQGKYSEALEYVEESMAMDSSLYQRYLFRAHIKVELGMFESAIVDVTKCIERCDCKTREYHVPSYYLERSKIHFYKADISSALNDINTSISLNSNDWQAYTWKAILYIQSEDFMSALIDLNKSIELNEKSGETYYIRGMVNLKLGDYVKACSDFKDAIALGFEEAKTWVYENCK